MGVSKIGYPFVLNYAIIYLITNYGSDFLNADREYNEIFLPKRINTDITSIDYIQGIFNNIKENTILDFSKIQFIDGELTPFLGINIRNLQKLGINFKIRENEQSDVSHFLTKNGFFYKILKSSKVWDYFHNAIQYNEINCRNQNEINDYISNVVFEQIKDKSNKSNDFMSGFSNAIFELADNVKTHSESNYITMCGQFYPKKKLLTFSLGDNGITIPRVVMTKINDFSFDSDSDAIQWSTLKGNTTKKKYKAGGLGLYVILKSIMENNGSITIVSNNGYWKRESSGEEIKHEMKNSFPGTLVIFQMDTSITNNINVFNDGEYELKF